MKATRDKAHTHRFDIHPQGPGRVYCLICGFSISSSFLRSRINLDACVARKNATQQVLNALGVDVDGNQVTA